jgi:hypothetical protein
MKDKSYVNVVLKNWALMHNLSEQNSKLLIVDAVKYTYVCANRMSELSFWETELLADLKPDHSPQAAAWLKAMNNKGCDGCWISSNSSSQHPECQEKIRAYFRAVEDLVDFGISI